jgi:hypothetical protein
MSSTEHTLVAVGVMFVTFVIGRILGFAKGNTQGYSDGVTDGVRTTFEAIQQLYGINFSYDLEIEDNKNEEESN